MNYCTLDDAFQEASNAPSPGCTVNYAAKAARKEERKRARRTKGPSAAYFDIADPDRQCYSNIRVEPSTAGNSTEAFDANRNTLQSDKMQHKTMDAQEMHNARENNAEYDKDPMNKYLDDETRGHYIVMPMKTDVLSHSAKKPAKYFGADMDGDAYADYMPDKEDYKLQPDFMSAFEHAGVARAGSMAKVPDPNANMYWKPTNANGAQTSFIEHLSPTDLYNDKNDYSPKIMMQRMDKLFARLDDMNQSSPEQITSELLMFISSGIFVIFMMDLLVKKGSTMRL
jgi:hypothetical protein